MTTFFPGHVYRHVPTWRAQEVDYNDVNVMDDSFLKDLDSKPEFFLLPGPAAQAWFPTTADLVTEAKRASFAHKKFNPQKPDELPSEPTAEESKNEPHYISEFSSKWGIDVTTNPDNCTDGPMLTVHGKVFVGDGDNNATYEANAPHLYVNGKVGIGDRSPFNSNPAIFQAPPTHHLYVVGATMIEDPIDVADPAKLPPVVNPLFHVKGFTTIEAPAKANSIADYMTPLVEILGPTVLKPGQHTVGETNPLLHIAGQTMIGDTNKVADPALSRCFSCNLS